MKVIQRIAALVAAFALVLACSADTFVDGDGGASDAAMCPDESGAYMISNSGSGCATLSGSPGQICITQNACTIDASSKSGAFTGMATIGPNGGFGGASITEGPLMRTGCSALWSSNNGALVVTCGGGDAGQSCVVTLTRTGTSC